MKIDVLSIGSFPAATNAELASRFAVTHHSHRPAPDRCRLAQAAHPRDLGERRVEGAARADRRSCRSSRSSRCSASATTASTSPRRASAASPSPTRRTSSTTRSPTWRSAWCSRSRAASRRPIATSAKASGRTGRCRWRARSAARDSASSASAGIGHAIAKRAEAFGMSIAYTARSAQPESRYRYFPSAEALAAEVDFLVVITPGGAGTRKLIDAKVLKALGQGRLPGQRRARLGGRRGGADRGAAERHDRRRRHSTCSRTSPTCRRSCSRSTTSSCSRTSAARPGRRARRWPSSFRQPQAHFAGKPLLSPVLNSLTVILRSERSCASLEG